MRTLMPLILLSTACGSAEITLSRTDITWGLVDFNRVLPAEGHDAVGLTITNTGSKPIQISLLGIDEKHITISTQVEIEDPPTLPWIEPDLTAIVEVGASGYEPGEWDTEIEGTFFIASNALKEHHEVTWSFTPTRDIGED